MLLVDDPYARLLLMSPTHSPPRQNGSSRPRSDKPHLTRHAPSPPLNGEISVACHSSRFRFDQFLFTASHPRTPIPPLLPKSAYPSPGGFEFRPISRDAKWGFLRTNYCINTDASPLPPPCSFPFISLFVFHQHVRDKDV